MAASLICIDVVMNRDGVIVVMAEKVSLNQPDDAYPTIWSRMSRVGFPLLHIVKYLFCKQE
jgi:hypothetical protein